MSHQKTKRIQSPLKGKFYSMIRQDNKSLNSTLFNSRLTIKRKPIFNDNAQRSQRANMSSLSPQRRKIFTNKQKSIYKDQQHHFSKILQSNQLQLKFGDDQQEILSSSQSSDSISSSSIESNQGLQQVKKKLFPSTPINKIIHDPEDLQDGRDFLTNSWKKLNFIQSDDPLKSNFTIGTSHIEKTVLKSNFNTPLKQDEQTITNKKIQQSSYKVCLNFDTTIKNLNLRHNKSFQSQQERINLPKKDLAKQLRELHEKLTAKSKTCMKVNDFSECLRKENQFLRKQNERLQQKFIQFQMKAKS